MSPDMFNLSALTELWQAQLTIGEVRWAFVQKGRTLGTEGHGKDIVSIL